MGKHLRVFTGWELDLGHRKSCDFKGIKHQQILKHPGNHNIWGVKNESLNGWLIIVLASLIRIQFAISPL